MVRKSYTPEQIINKLREAEGFFLNRGILTVRVANKTDF